LVDFGGVPIDFGEPGIVIQTSTRYVYIVGIK
jgi:hypothetical protein